MTKTERTIWLQRYHSQKGHAKRRGILFKLTFEQWLRIWKKSGHMADYGRRYGQYCMGRYGDKGPYAVGNVKIIPHGHNVREAQSGRKHGEAEVVKMRKAVAEALSRPEVRERMSEAATNRSPELRARIGKAISAAFERRRRAKIGN